MRHGQTFKTGTSAALLAAMTLASAALFSLPGLADDVAGPAEADGLLIPEDLSVSGAKAADSAPAAPPSVFLEPVATPASGYYAGAWLDWPKTPGEASLAWNPLAGRNSPAGPFGSGGLVGLSFGGGYSFPVRERGSLGLYGAVNISSFSRDSPGEQPALYGYVLSTPFRARLGGRYSHVFSNGLRGFFGLGLDHGIGGLGGPSDRTPRIPLNGPAGASAFAEMGFNVTSFGDVTFDISTYGLSGGTGDSSGGMSMVFSF
ncbi:MAG: hypothetical protein LBW85_14230 [Deltaproteobacteria bacterium]|jgi:hypothetical protein|nr:hypothetical protein [Deltaproteobacteria bacterium]